MAAVAPAAMVTVAAASVTAVTPKRTLASFGPPPSAFCLVGPAPLGGLAARRRSALGIPRPRHAWLGHGRS